MQFLERVEDAYEHFYDLVYLRTHPLVDLLVHDRSLSRKDRAWRLHHILLEAIDELDPGPQAPAFSHEWRRHRLMVLRYVDGLDPQSVADQLAVGRRHYYREQTAAMKVIAKVLWDRYVEQASQAAEAEEPEREEAPLSRLELLRLEAARSAQGNRYTSLADVVQGVLSLWQERLKERRLEVQATLPDNLPQVSVQRNLLRQVLLGLLGYLVERTTEATIRLAAEAEEATLHLSLTSVPASAVQPTSQAEVQERLSAFDELAGLAHARVLPILAGKVVAGFDLQLPTGAQRTVLVVDDNEDVLELFQRYLAPHQYQVAMARTAGEALDLACRMKPHAITLDLMMPEQDGWDLLRQLLDRPDTRDVPVIVCSVLRQKEAALSLGATAFLPKPVTEEALLRVLEALE
ncbi:MAG: response regulator [Anaerolineae bacterium]|nr:response regulator [Anaerolineae bacterium]